MFWTSERVNWREEATGVGARKRSTAAIHAAEGGTGTRAGTGTVNGAAETFVCTGTSTGVRVSVQEYANVRLPAHQCHGDGRCRSRGDGSRNGSRDRRGVFPQGQFKLVPKHLTFLRLRLGVFLRKLDD